MSDKARVIAHNGLRLRDSPRDGLTLEVIRETEELEVLGRETWLRVRHGAQVGFVLADHVEPVDSTTSPAAVAAPVVPAVPAPTPAAAPSAVSPGAAVGGAPASSVANIIEFPFTPVFAGTPLRIDSDFAGAANGIARLAQELGIVVLVTSSLREPNKAVENAIVTPARFSNHHVGHAIDMNVILNGESFRSKELGRFESLPQPVQAFLNRVRSDLGLRWGGDFSTPDPVHIDDGLNLRKPAVFQAKLAALWGVAAVR